MVNILILVVAAFAQHTKEENEKKDILYKELLETHKKLKEYTDELNRLSVIEERNKIARDIHDNLGHNMTALIMQLQMVEHYAKTDPEKAIKILVEEFSQKTGIKIELKIDGEVTNNHGANSAIYHILQEGLTNAVRHGKADRILVELKYTEEYIKFYIKDNGQGALAFIEGYGIKGIKERVRDNDGSVEFTSENGIIIDGMIKIGGKND